MPTALILMMMVTQLAAASPCGASQAHHHVGRYSYRTRSFPPNPFIHLLTPSLTQKGPEFAELPILLEAGESDISSMCKRLQHAVIPVIETLEGRLLLSASVQGTTLVVEGNATAPNKISVSCVRKTHSIRIIENRVRQDFAIAGLTALQVTGGSGKDIIVVGAGVSLPTTINGMGGNDQITGGAENDTIITGQGSSVVHPGLGVNSIDLTLGSNRAYLTRKAQDTIIATKQDKVIGATKSTQIEAPSTPAGAPVSPPLPPVPPLPPAPASPPEVIPGTGFTGPTPQPQQIGTGFGSTENAIARWDVVPYQTFSGTFNIGVVAFDSNGINRVSFSVNGGNWVDVSQMTLDPQTNVNEYTAELNAADFAADGQIEVRAIVYPNAGVPRVLQGSTITINGAYSLFLNVNAHGTLPMVAEYVSTNGSDTSGDGSQSNPYATIMKAANAIQVASGGATADNGTVYLEPGDYQLGPYSYSLYTVTQSGWLTISSAPGAAQSSVRLTGSYDTNGIRTTLVHVKNLTITGQLSNVINTVLWTDGCSIIGAGQNIAQVDYGLGWSAFVTDSSIEQWQDGFISDLLVRNSTVHDIGAIAFMGVGTLLNCTVANINPGSTGWHPDVFQLWSNPGNVIIDGLEAVNGINAQGIFAGDSVSVTDAAIVNTNIDNSITGYMRCFSFGGATQNLFVLEANFDGGNNLWDSTEEHFAGVDVLVESTTFSPSPGEISGVTYR